jgi:hypothetical protein
VTRGMVVSNPGDLMYGIDGSVKYSLMSLILLKLLIHHYMLVEVTFFGDSS